MVQVHHRPPLQTLRSLVGWLVASCLLSLAAGAIVRNQLAIGQSFWLIPRDLFVQRDQNLNMPAALVLVAVLGSGLPVTVAALAISHAARQSSGLLMAVVGIGVGGGVANAVEAVWRGSVTDFVGIVDSGIFSAGDIAYWAGAVLLPIAMDRAIRARCSSTGRVVVAASAVSLVGGAALIRGHEPLAIGVALLAIGTSATVLLAEHIGLVHRPSPP